MIARVPASELWEEYLVTPGGADIPNGGPICGLCGNSGWIDTRATARSPVGKVCGDIFPCICPNGRSVKQHGVVVGQLIKIGGSHEGGDTSP